MKVTESLDSWTNSSSNRNDHGGKKLAEISGFRTMTSAAFQHEHNGEFYRLLFAVLNEPEKVPAIVKERPAILEETNFTGETVLHWLAVENHTDGIALLRSLGAKIPLFALIHAVEHVHLETIILLLELGADPEGFPVDRMLEHPMREITKREKQIVRSYFRQFGYEA